MRWFDFNFYGGEFCIILFLRGEMYIFINKNVRNGWSFFFRRTLDGFCVKVLSLLLKLINFGRDLIWTKKNYLLLEYYFLEYLGTTKNFSLIIDFVWSEVSGEIFFKNTDLTQEKLLGILDADLIFCSNFLHLLKAVYYKV